MKSKLNNFILNLSVFSVILGLITYVLTFLLPSKYFSPALPFLFPFFFSTTLIIYFFLAKSGAKSNSFINRFMLATFFKLMVYMSVLIIYVLMYKEDAIPFIISFFILYLGYTIFEVISILKYQKIEKK